MPLGTPSLRLIPRLGAAPPLLVMAGASIASRSKLPSFAVVSGALLISGTVLWYLVDKNEYYKIARKQPFREITMDAVGVLDAADDIPIFALEFGGTYYFDYYFRQLGAKYRVTKGASSPSAVDRWAREALVAKQRVLVLTGHIRLPKPILLIWRRDFRMTVKNRSPKTSLVLLERKRVGRR